MGKRHARDRDVNSAFQDGPMSIRKKQKVVHEAPTSELITSSRHMRMLLSYEPDSRKTRHGLQSFKLFLDALNTSDNNGNIPENREMLRQFLESQAPQPNDKDEEFIYLVDVFQTWSNAVQTHNDGILSGVMVVLALLLQVLSSDLSLVRHAMGICEAILQERHLKLLARNLSSDPSKGFIISPTLRLIREIISLDGGFFARRVFRARQYTLAEFVRNIEVKHNGNGVVEDATKASVRTNSLRLFTTLLRFLPSDDRKELVLTRGLMSHITFLIKDDAPSILSDLIESFTKYFIMDSKIPLQAKSLAFSAKILIRLLNLYNYNHDAKFNPIVTITDQIHNFLMLACTSKTSGIMLRSSGLYPEGLDQATVFSGHERPGMMGAESLSWMDRFKADVPVINTDLLEFTLKLRPWASLQHSELLVGCFNACPELVAAYFQKQIAFTFDPNLSMTWIGYAAFLFNTISLPLPESFGDGTRVAANIPPPSSVLLDNILPPALNQKVLTRCLDPKSALVSFFSTRILVVAMQKFGTALKMYQDSSEFPIWRHAQRKLLDDLCHRIPDMKEVVRSYKAIPVENILHTTAASHLLALYYKHVPQVALTANFDAATLLISALSRLDTDFENPKDKAVALIELENLLEIASFSPGMRWFAKVEGMTTSPFTALLRLAACNREHALHSTKLENILSSVAVEHQMVSKSSGIKPLIKAVGNTEDVDDDEWVVLDNCIQRSSTSPLKYIDLITEYAGEAIISTDNTLSLLLVTLAEQVPHICKSADDGVLMTLAEFISVYANNCVVMGETESLILCLCIRIKEHLPWLTLPDSPKRVLTKKQANAEVNVININEVDTKTVTGQEYASTLALLIAELEDFRIDNQALTRWANKSPEDLIDNGYATAVFKLLLSEHISIRRQTYTALLKMAGKVKESSHNEKEQIWLLISELAESSKNFVADGPVPSQYIAFAVHALPILTNPLHALYPKINRFLTKGPVWASTKLPVIHDILHGEPSDDDKLYLEFSWLISYLTDSLIIKQDLVLFYRNNWLEKILCVSCNPNLRVGLRSKMQKLVYKITTFKGGSTMLITRFGIMSWLKIQESVMHKSNERLIFKALNQIVWDTCDKEHVQKWSGEDVSRILKV